MNWSAKSATVAIEDRGPYVSGRVIDVAPKVADQRELENTGVSRVEAAPITVPQPDAALKLVPEQQA
jgi:rare lipoprotein A